MACCNLRAVLKVIEVLFWISLVCMVILFIPMLINGIKPCTYDAKLPDYVDVIYNMRKYDNDEKALNYFKLSQVQRMCFVYSVNYDNDAKLYMNIGLILGIGLAVIILHKFESIEKYAIDKYWTNCWWFWFYIAVGLVQSFMNYIPFFDELPLFNTESTSTFTLFLTQSIFLLILIVSCLVQIKLIRRIRKAMPEDNSSLNRGKADIA